MYYALKERMTKGEFAFIMYEESPVEVWRKLKRPFMWFFPSYSNAFESMRKIRDEAFKVVIVLGPSAEKREYIKFTEELKRRMTEFGSDSYSGLERNGRPRNMSMVSHILFYQNLAKNRSWYVQKVSYFIDHSIMTSRGRISVW